MELKVVKTKKREYLLAFGKCRSNENIKKYKKAKTYTKQAIHKKKLEVHETSYTQEKIRSARR